jgi:hypothetical protein
MFASHPFNKPHYFCCFCEPLTMPRTNDNNKSNMAPTKRKYKKRPKRNGNSTFNESCACPDGICGKVFASKQGMSNHYLYYSQCHKVFPLDRQRSGNNEKRKPTPRTKRLFLAPTRTTKTMLLSSTLMRNIRSPTRTARTFHRGLKLVRLQMYMPWPSNVASSTPSRILSKRNS